MTMRETALGNKRTGVSMNSRHYKPKGKQKMPWGTIGQQRRQSLALRDSQDGVGLSTLGSSVQQGGLNPQSGFSKTQFNRRIWTAQAIGMANRSIAQTGGSGTPVTTTQTNGPNFSINKDKQAG